MIQRCLQSTSWSRGASGNCDVPAPRTEVQGTCQCTAHSRKELQSIVDAEHTAKRGVAEHDCREGRQHALWQVSAKHTIKAIIRNGCD